MTLEQEIAKALAKQASEIFSEVYGDLLKPGVQQVGTALGTILGLGNTLLWPVVWLNGIGKITLSASLERFRTKMKDTPEDEVCAVPPEIGVPILEKLSYVTDEELSEMYIELLAKASQKQSAKVAHPSFVNIINNISPDEAILMRSIRNTDAIPFIEVRVPKLNTVGRWTPFHPMILPPEKLSELAYPENGAAYISNLSGLGIFNVVPNCYIGTENAYEPIERYARELYPEEKYDQEGVRLLLVRGAIWVTPFARLFFKACFSRKP